MSGEAERTGEDRTAQILSVAVGQVSKGIGENYDRWLSKINSLQKWPPQEVARRYQAIPAMLAFLKVLQETCLKVSWRRLKHLSPGRRICTKGLRPPSKRSAPRSTTLSSGRRTAAALNRLAPLLLSQL